MITLRIAPGSAGGARHRPDGRASVRFLDPILRMRAAAVRAGLVGAALPDLAAVIDRDLPGFLRGQPDRVPFAPPRSQPTE